MVGRGRVFSIFGELRHDPPTANLDLTLGATCPEADPSCFSHCFFPCFPVRCGFLHEDVLPRGLRQPADFPTSVASISWCVIGRIRPRRSNYLRAKHCLPNFEMLSSQLAFPGFGEPWILQSFCWSFSSQFPCTARRDFCMPLAEHMRLDPCRIKAELVQLPVAKELYDKQGQKIHD